MPKLVEALDAQAAKFVWDVPDRYQGGADRMLLTAVAYAFSLYVRAWSYAWTLGDHYSDPFYRCVWVRSSALDTDEPFGSERQPVAIPDWFPWAAVLTRIFGDSHDDEGRVSAVLSGIREQSDVFFEEYCRLLKVSRRSGDDKTQHDRDVLIAEVLQNAGATPKLKRRTQVQRLLTFVRAIFGSRSIQASAGAGGAALARAEKVLAHVAPEWIDRAAGSLELRFRRERFWELFDQRPLTPVRDWEQNIIAVQ